MVEGAAVHTLYLAPDQTLWVGATAGLYRREFTGAWLRFDERDGLPFHVVHKNRARSRGAHLDLHSSRPGAARPEYRGRTAGGLPGRDRRHRVTVSRPQ